MINDLINQMVEAGVHLGHQTRKWHPSMKKYLLKDKAGIHIINLEETEKCLDKACSFLADLARRRALDVRFIELMPIGLGSSLPSAKLRKPLVSTMSTTAGWAACSPT